MNHDLSREERHALQLANTRRLFENPLPVPMTRALPPAPPAAVRLGRFAAAATVLAASWIYLDFNKAGTAPTAVTHTASVARFANPKISILEPLPELCRIGEGTYRSLSANFSDCVQMADYFGGREAPATAAYHAPRQPARVKIEPPRREAAPLDDPSSYPENKRRAAPLDDPSSYPSRRSQKRAERSPFTL